MGRRQDDLAIDRRHARGGRFDIAPQLFARLDSCAQDTDRFDGGRREMARRHSPRSARSNVSRSASDSTTRPWRSSGSRAIVRSQRLSDSRYSRTAPVTCKISSALRSVHAIVLFKQMAHVLHFF